jgi:hypothetical protein
VVRLPTYEDSINTFTGVEAIASGFGKTSESRNNLTHIKQSLDIFHKKLADPPADRLQYTILTVMSSVDCAALVPNVINPSKLCTHATKNNTICYVKKFLLLCSNLNFVSSNIKHLLVNLQGDSGGPLVYKPANDGWTIIGVSSFVVGAGCGAGPAGFARVTSGLGWLDQHLGTTSNFPTTNNYPWHAYINRDDGQFVSIGALIKPQWILTAAHGISKYKIFISLKNQSNVYFQEFQLHRSIGLSLSFAK